jgi:isocitrate dehydrogenase
VTKAARPSQQQVLHTFTNVKTEVAGCDLYLDSDLSPTALASAMTQMAEGSPFKLTLISNRGTQIWPTGSVYTECVDYYRVRFELAQPGTQVEQSHALALLNKVAARFTVCNYELLRNFDGVRGYSLAQGQ